MVAPGGPLGAVAGEALPPPVWPVAIAADAAAICDWAAVLAAIAGVALTLERVIPIVFPLRRKR